MNEKPFAITLTITGVRNGNEKPKIDLHAIGVDPTTALAYTQSITEKLTPETVSKRS